jgi:PAS domain S-box-containing protein
MSMKPAATFSKNLLERLTRPSAVFVGEESQQKAHLLASLSLALAIAIGVMAPIWVIFVPDLTAAPYLALGTFGASILAYGLSRTRFYRAGALILIGTTWVWVWLVILLSPGPLTDRMVVLNFLVIAVMVADLFLERPFTVLIAVISFASIVAFFFVPTVPFIFTYSYVAFFLLLSILGAISNTLQQHYKQKVAESELLYRSLVAALSEGVILQLADGSIEACNASAEHILGVTAEQMMERSVADPGLQAICEDGSPFLHETHPAVVTLRTGQPLANIVIGIHQPNGALRWVSINSQPLIRSGEDAPYAVVASLTDITKRKQAEEELNQRHEELDRFFRVTPDLLCIADTKGYFIKVNRAWEDSLGYTAAELEGQCFLDYVHPDDIQSTLTVILTLDAQQTVWHFINRYRAKDGSYRILEWRSQPIGSKIYAAARDITERKQAEEALRQSEERYKGVVDTQTELICRYLPDSTLVFVNDAYCRYYGQSREELIGRSFLNLIPDQHRAKARAHYLSLLENPRTEEYEHMEVTSTGATRWQEWVERVLVDDEGQPVEIQVVGRDVTEHKLAQQREFELTLEKERVQLLTDFIQNAAHEFRTPLAIIETTSFVLARVDEAEKRHKKVAIINKQIARMVRLIEMLLLMARLKSKVEMRADVSAIHLGAFIENIAQKQVAEHGPQPILHYQKPTMLPLLMGDLDSLQEAVKQILENAYRFTPAEGSITITTGHDNEQIWVAVQDTGGGIAEERLSTIFQTFWRQDVAHTTPGFGLGLSIAQRIVEAHGGRIEVTSQIGHGSTFTMILPRKF